MCRELGFAHPDHLLDQLTSRQLSEWEAYDRLDPIGEWRVDFRMASLEAFISNIVTKIWGEKGSKLSTPLDFMTEWDKEKLDEEVKDAEDTFMSWTDHGWVERTKQSTEQMKQMMLTIAKAQNTKQRQLRTDPPRKKK